MDAAVQDMDFGYLPGSFQSRLPIELHELIVNALDGEEQALRHCALTCKLYRPLAQRLLFKHLEINFQSCSDMDPEIFLSILSHSPHIADYVRRLSYCLHNSRLPKWDAEPMLAIFSALRNINHLQLSGDRADLINFFSLEPTLQAMIKLKCPSVRHLTLAGIIDMPLTVLSACTSLESLDVREVEFANDDCPGSDRGDSKASFTHLRRMKISGIVGQEMQLICPFMMHSTTQGGLESLSIDMGNFGIPVPFNDLHPVSGIIRNSAKSLKSIDITVTADLPNEALLNVSAMPLLEDISLTGCIVNFQTTENRDPINLHWLSRNLETVPSYPSSGRKFRKVLLHSIIVEAKAVTEEAFDEDSLKQFEDLVLRVISPQTLSLSVKFTIWPGLDDITSAQRAKGLIRERLHGLHARKLLELHVPYKSRTSPDIHGL
ncbi:hypothetical protein CPC08DRAFT_771165 [Agrocybe pediades]|nr:hypothetical protein CPC08DRAFT_771165 [Agrocybe pediades]